MYRFRRIMSATMVLLILLSCSFYPYLHDDNTPRVFGAKNSSDTGTTVTSAPDTTVTMAVYMTDEEIVQADYNWLTCWLISESDFCDQVTSDLYLPTTGEHGSTISWASSDETVVATDGTVTRPTYTQGDAEVEATATITYGDAEAEKPFYITVVAAEITSAERVALAKAWLTEELVLNGNSAGDVKVDLYLPESAPAPAPGYPWEDCDSTISWASSETVVAADGTVTRPLRTEEDMPVTLTATISHGDVQEDKTFAVVVTPVDAVALKFDDFSNLQDRLQFNGVADTTTTQDRHDYSIQALQFISDGQKTGGSVFTGNKLHLTDDLSFSTTFTFRNAIDSRFITGDGGFTFVLQADDNTKYGDDTIIPSISIAFDTKYSSAPGSGQETNYSFVSTAAVCFNGHNDASYENGRKAFLHTDTTSVPADINTAWIEYDGYSGNLDIRFSLTGERPSTPTLQVTDLDLGEIFTDVDDSLSIEDVQDVYAGFTGSMGDAGDESGIWGWYFKNDATPIDFSPHNFIEANVTLPDDLLGGQPSSTITATVSGIDGPVSDIEVVFTTSFGFLNATTAWTDEAGKASVQLSSDISGTATVKATIVEGGATATTEVVLAVTDGDRLELDKSWIADNVLKDNQDFNKIISDLFMPDTGQYGSEIQWESSNEQVVGLNGKVTTPAYEDGPQEVTITATLTMGDLEPEQISFSLTVLVLDDDIVTGDKLWLTDERVLKNNEIRDQVTGDLYLPGEGQYGSTISWGAEPQSQSVVNLNDGTVSRPTYFEDDKEVTLTATISKGEAQREKTFELTVKALAPDDAMIVAADKEWLDDEGESLLIDGTLNTSLNEVIADLNLPGRGIYGSTISWESSHSNVLEWDEAAEKGIVTRPFEDTEVTLTATISKGDVTLQKVYVVTVKAVTVLTDREIVDKDSSWLDISRTLGENEAADAITVRLNLMAAGPAGSSITWQSYDTSVMWSNGVLVKRPAFGEENQTVTLRARISKGNEELVKFFEYTVLALPPLPQVVETNPQEGVEVDFDTKELTIVFNEEIWRMASSIELNGPGSPGFRVRTEGKKLLIALDQRMEHGEYELLIPQGAVRDLYGRQLEEFRLSFSVEERLIREIVVQSATIGDRQSGVSIEPEISFQYSFSEIHDARRFEDISLRNRDSGRKVEITKTLVGNTVFIELGSGVKLEHGLGYELIIPAGAVEDRFENQSSGKRIQFVTEGSARRPEVTMVYPMQGQVGVGINQGIEIEFSEVVSALHYHIHLVDENDHNMRTHHFSFPAWSFYEGYREPYITERVVLELLEPLLPNTEYTVKVDHVGVRNILGNPMAYDYSWSFTTGRNALKIQHVSPIDQGNTSGSFRYRNTAQARPDTNIKIELSSSVTRGEGFPRVELLDSDGNPVEHLAELRDNLVVLTPLEGLVSEETYRVIIPEGAYMAGEGDFNDSYEFEFTTARRVLNADFTSFEVKPDLNAILDRPVYFDTSTIERVFGNSASEIVSWEWDLGDGAASEIKDPQHTYSQTGEYEVRLRIVDDQGFSYEFDEQIIVEDIKDLDLQIRVNPSTQRVVLRDDGFYTDGVMLPSRRVDHLSFEIDVLLQHRYLPEEEVRINLYRNGHLEAEMGFRQTGSGDYSYVDEWGFTQSNYGRAFYSFDLNRYNLLTAFTYEIGFKSGGSEVRVPLIIEDQRFKEQPMRIKVYHEETGEQYISNELSFIINGELIKGYYLDGSYLLPKAMPCSMVYNIKLDSSDPQILYYSDEMTKMHLSQHYPINLFIRPKELGIIERVTSVISDSHDGLDTRVIFGVDMPEIEFKAQGDWAGIDPGLGYYEVNAPGWWRRDNFKFNGDGPILIRPDIYGTEERMKVRMVVPEPRRPGHFIKSDWVDAGIEVIPNPRNYIRGLDSLYKDGDFLFKIPLEKYGYNARTPILNSVPLMGDLGSAFGIWGDDVYDLKGKFDDWDTIQLTFEEAFQGGTSHIPMKLVSSGFDFESNTKAIAVFTYNSDTQNWEETALQYTTISDGSIYRSKPYTIPKVGIEARGVIRLGTEAGGTVIQQRNDLGSFDDLGIIYFSPYVRASIGVGSEYAAKVEGWVLGEIGSEVHIPTRYMKVVPNISAGIDVTILYVFSGTVLDVTVAELTWETSDREPVQPLMMMDQALAQEFDMEDIEFTPISRSYLHESQWLGGGDSAGNHIFMAMMVAEDNPQISEMKENIFPQAEIQLVRNGDELWLVWNDDNPARSNMNRSQMMYSVFSGGTWSEAKWMGDNGTPDFNPAATSTGDGTLMAWQTMKTPMADDAEMWQFIVNSEISVTESVYRSDGNDVQVVMLTDDDKFNHSPRLVADEDYGLLVWTRSEGLHFDLGEDMEEYLASENSDSLVYARWDGSTWSTPLEIEGSLPQVTETSLTMHGNEALLLYVLHTDNDPLSPGEEQLFARVYDGNNWGNAVGITDTVAATNPRAVYSGGDWFITWHQDEGIVYRKGLTGETMTEDFLAQVEFRYEMTKSEGANPQIALIFTPTEENNKRSLSASFYDVNQGVWSDRITLTEADGFIRSLSPEFSADNKLHIAYTEAQVATGFIGGLEIPYTSDNVSLKMLTYTPNRLLALNVEDGLSVSPGNPLPGTMAKVQATIRNEGDFAEHAAIYLYDGRPEEGNEIGRVQTTEPIPARSFKEVEIQWIVAPEERERIELYALLHSDDQGVVDENNKTISTEIITADVSITNVEYRHLANDDYLVNAVIRNVGSRKLEDVSVHLIRVDGEKTLETQVFEELTLLQEIMIEFLVSSGELLEDENGAVQMTLEARLPEGEQRSTGNSIYHFQLEPAPLFVQRSNIRNGETQVGLQESFTLTFNRPLEKGPDFGQITIEDGAFNKVKVNKTIEGRRLTVTPEEPMDYHTRYTLLVPEEGVLYDRREMKSSYSLGFVTITTHPEVVFAYPFDGMGEVKVDTGVYVQFNQEVIEGPTFAGIALKASNPGEVSARISLEGDMLAIVPEENLGKNMMYTVVLPVDAVKNHRGEMSREYSLAFDTGDPQDEPGPGPVRPGPGPGPGPELPPQGIITTTSADGKTVTLSVTVTITIDEESGRRIALVDEKILRELLRLAQEAESKGQKVVLEILVETGINTEALEVEMPGDIFRQLASATNAAIRINTGKEQILFDANAVNTIAGAAAEGNIRVSMAKADINLLPEEVREKVGDRPVYGFSVRAGAVLVSDFGGGQANISIAYTPGRAENKNALIVYHINDEGEVKIIRGKYNEESSTMNFTTSHFSLFTTGYNEVIFDDVLSNEWYYDAVCFVAAREIVKGVGENRFTPQRNVTRADFLVMVMRAYGIEADPDITENFADAGDTYYTGHLASAKKLGLVKGVGNNLYLPQETISRQDMFVILVRLLKLIDELPENKGSQSLKDFDDTGDISAYARDALELLVKTETIMGDGKKLYPGNSATRAETAQIIKRLLSR